MSLCCKCWGYYEINPWKSLIGAISRILIGPGTKSWLLEGPKKSGFPYTTQRFTSGRGAGARGAPAIMFEIYNINSGEKIVKSTLFCKVKCVMSSIVAKNVYWEGIQERTVTLRFLGIISRVLRLEVSTLDFCLSTRCYSPNLSFLHWSIVLYGFLKP